MEINKPEIIAEVTAHFMEYETALSTNDVDTIDRLFWNSPFTLRYGPNGTLIGHAALSEFRRNRKTSGIKRTLRNTIITTFGSDFAVANTESMRGEIINRQSQTWARMPDGWRIVSAHVSDEPKQ
jgi:hypothetical protein